MVASKLADCGQKVVQVEWFLELELCVVTKHRLTIVYKRITLLTKNNLWNFYLVFNSNYIVPVERTKMTDYKKILSTEIGNKHLKKKPQ